MAHGGGGKKIQKTNGKTRRKYLQKPQKFVTQHDRRIKTERFSSTFRIAFSALRFPHRVFRIAFSASRFPHRVFRSRGF
jgi:hypothetical protein